MTEVDVEFSDLSEQVEIKSTPAPPAGGFFQQNIPVVPLLAMGNFECNICPFRTKHDAELGEHRKIKHGSGYYYEAHGVETSPVLEQENAGHIEKYTLKCGFCGFTSRYKTILDTHIQNEQHVIANDLSNKKNHPYLQQENYINLPEWAMGNLKCGQCSFTAKYKTILDYHLTKENHVTRTYYHHARQTKVKQNKVIYKGKSISMIIIEAIQSSKGGKATLKEIYSYFDDHFPNKEKVQKATQNTIRHTLSINKKFYQKEKGYWQVKPGGSPAKRNNVDTVETETWY